MLRKSIYRWIYVFIYTWINGETFYEISLPEKEHFYSSQNIEDIADAGYKHMKRAWKEFEIKNRVKIHDLYIQSHKVLLSENL